MPPLGYHNLTRFNNRLSRSFEHHRVPIFDTHGTATGETDGTAAAVRRFPGDMSRQSQAGELQIVAIGFLTQSELSDLGEKLTRVYPVDDRAAFADLLDAIDVADRRYLRDRNRRR